VKRRKKISKKRKFLDKKLVFSTGIIAIIVLGLVCYKVFFQTPVKFSLKAAIIDQLGFGDTQNPEFNNTVTSLLIERGFSVSYHESETITVNFYKELAKYNYGIIILRTHSALRDDPNDPTKVKKIVDLFTSENYTDERAYELLEERSRGLLSKGEYLWEPGKFYFAITPKFIENLDGYFPKSIVIAMGCWSLKPGCEQMAEAFIQKGAEAYIGWTDMVYPQDTDNETVNLLNMLLEDKSLANAISETSNYTCTSGSYTVTTRLDFYPKLAGNLTLSELIKEAKSSTALQSATNNLKLLSPLFCSINVINHRSKDFTISN
jgi:hypothetical protein